MICPKCNRFVQDGSEFCVNCGAKLSVHQQPLASEQPSASPNLCPHCSAVVEPSNAFCMNCGAQLAAPAQNMQYGAPSQPYNPNMAPSAQPASSGGFCGKGVLALVMSVISLTFSFSLLAPFFGICGILGIIFGAVGMKQARAQNLSGRGLAVAGLVVGIVATIFSYLFGLLVFFDFLAYLV